MLDFSDDKVLEDRGRYYCCISVTSRDSTPRKLQDHLAKSCRLVPRGERHAI